MVSYFHLLSPSWLSELTGADLQAVRRDPILGPHARDPAALRVAFTDLFLLNVYPYASVFLEPTGELNGQRARELEALYHQANYAPPALAGVAAADHIGLALSFAGMAERDDIWPYLLDWIPILCFAVEREPGAHAFYRELARLTREAVLSADLPAPLDAPLPMLADDEAEDEISLRWVVRRLLAPAQCGVFLSRARLGAWAHKLGMPVPFGERFTVASALFEAAGASDQVEVLLDLLREELKTWEAAYGAWVECWPAWEPYALPWRDRVARTLRLLDEMQRAARDAAEG